MDNAAIKLAEKLKSKIEGIEFVFVKPNEDLPFVNEKNVVLMDVVRGIEEVTLLDENNLNNLKVDKGVSVHDWDLGFQLKYLKKLGKLKKVTIIGLPMGKEIDIIAAKKLILELLN